MFRSTASALSVSFVIVSACATGAVTGGDDAGIKKDSGIIVANDSGNPGDDSSPPPPQDSGKPPVDSGGNCAKSPPSNVCGVYPQCGCGAQQTCEVNQTALDGSSSCVNAGTGALGSACTATAGQCAAGLTCIWGQCHAYCGADGAQCTEPNTNYCINLTDSNQQPVENLLICHNDCALENPSSCGGGAEGCVYFDVDKVDCYPVGTASTCTAQNPECAPGQVCVFDGVSTYSCAPWCRMNANDCITGTCNAFGTPPTVNGVQYGYCQ